MAFPIWPRRILRALRDQRDVLDTDRCPGLRLYDRLFDVADIAQKADRAHVNLLQAGLHKAAARVHIVVGELLLDLPDTKPVGNQLVRIDDHVILTRRASEADDVYDVWNRLELFFQRPVLNGFQVHQVVLGICAAQRVPVDLPDGTEIRTDLRLQAVR